MQTWSIPHYQSRWLPGCMGLLRQAERACAVDARLRRRSSQLASSGILTSPHSQKMAVIAHTVNPIIIIHLTVFLLQRDLCTIWLPS